MALENRAVLAALEVLSQVVRDLGEKIDAIHLRIGADGPERPWLGDKHAASEALGCSTDLLATYRSRTERQWRESEDYPWAEGTHFFRNGIGKTCSFTYNLRLLADWRLNRLNHCAHQRAVDEFKRYKGEGGG